MKEDGLGLATLETGVSQERKCITLCYLLQLPNTRVVAVFMEEASAGEQQRGFRQNSVAWSILIGFQV